MPIEININRDREEEIINSKQLKLGDHVRSTHNHEDYDENYTRYGLVIQKIPTSIKIAFYTSKTQLEQPDNFVPNVIKDYPVDYDGLVLCIFCMEGTNSDLIKTKDKANHLCIICKKWCKDCDCQLCQLKRKEIPQTSFL